LENVKEAKTVFQYDRLEKYRTPNPGKTIDTARCKKNLIHAYVCNGKTKHLQNVFICCIAAVGTEAYLSISFRKVDLDQ
jgi:hypothetical protein